MRFRTRGVATRKALESLAAFSHPARRSVHPQRPALARKRWLVQSTPAVAARRSTHEGTKRKYVRYHPKTSSSESPAPAHAVFSCSMCHARAKLRRSAHRSASWDATPETALEKQSRHVRHARGEVPPYPSGRRLPRPTKSLRPRSARSRAASAVSSPLACSSPTLTRQARPQSRPPQPRDSPHSARATLHRPAAHIQREDLGPRESVSNPSFSPVIIHVEAASAARQGKRTSTAHER